MGLDTCNILLWILREFLKLNGLSLFQDYVHHILDVSFVLMCVGGRWWVLFAIVRWPELFQAGDINVFGTQTEQWLRLTKQVKPRSVASCCGWQEVGCGEWCLPLWASTHTCSTPSDACCTIKRTWSRNEFCILASCVHTVCMLSWTNITV
jgi:hypothetical protein